MTASDKKQLQSLQQLAQAATGIMSNLGQTSLNERLTLIAKYVVEIIDAEVCRVFLVSRPGWLIAKASYGDREGSFQRGEEYPIRSGH